MDGVLADFGAAFHAVEARLFPDAPALPAGEPESEAVAQEAAPESQAKVDGPYELRRRREAIWAEIRRTPDFWTTLQPTEAGSVRTLHRLMLRHRWEVFFITQRPATDGDTVQRQTQHWLVAQGFDLPSVLVIAGSRGAAAGALRLDYHVDDSPQNCLDVMAASAARPILIAAGPEIGQPDRTQDGDGPLSRHRAGARPARSGLVGARQPAAAQAARRDGGVEIELRLGSTGAEGSTGAQGAWFYTVPQDAAFERC